MELSIEQQRLASMLEYLEHWDKLDRIPTFDVGTHQVGFLAWQRDLETLPGVNLNISDATGEVWMLVERLRTEKPPTPHESLIPWIILKDDPSCEPSYRETLPDPAAPGEDLVFEENEALVGAFKAYRYGPWPKWAEAESPRRKSIDVYDKLFNLLQTIETDGAQTAVELVWGIGTALWNRDGKRIRYPLVSRLVEIDPISTDMALRIRPRDVPAVLEADIYASLGIPGFQVFERAARTILDHPDSDVCPFDESSYEQILLAATGNLDEHARYWPRESGYARGQLPMADDVLTVTSTWVVFARRKGTDFLIRDVRALHAAVTENPVSEGAARTLVETPDGPVPERRTRRWRGVSSDGFGDSGAASSATGCIGELYFPKPFNAEQVKIIDRLEDANGVVVQGPPGTGKTHTIANVICHYLAEGKSVLVTSKGESALSVLREQLPEPVRSLTVSLLTSERDGLRQLEQSIRDITSNVADLDKVRLLREIDESRRAIDDLHGRIAMVDRELGDWAIKNIDPVPPTLDGLRPTALAQHVLEHQAVHAWFPDRLGSKQSHETIFSLNEVVELRAARMQVGADLVYLETPVPSIESLPSVPLIGDLHRSLLELVSVTEVIDEQNLPRFRQTISNRLEFADDLRKRLLSAIPVRRRLASPWGDWLLLQEAQETADATFSVLSDLAIELSGLVDDGKRNLGFAFEWEEDWDFDDDLHRAIENSSAGKLPFGLFPFGHRTARERYARLRLNGEQPQSPEQWQRIGFEATLRRRLRVLISRWNSLCGDCPSPSLPSKPREALRVAEQILADFRDARLWVSETEPRIRSEIAAVFENLNCDGVTDDANRMNALADAIWTRTKRHRLERAREEQVRLRGLFANSPLPRFRRAVRFLDEFLGQNGRETIDVEREWESILAEFARLNECQPALATIRRLCCAIEAAGARNWALRLRTEPDVEGGFDWIPENWHDAWKWSRQFGYLCDIDGRERVQGLSRLRSDLQNDLSSKYSKLVEQLTWLKLGDIMDRDRGLKPALQQYMAAIRGIGKGTGVRAERNRGDARRAMKRAHRAVRCWIMPHWRVSESLPPELGMFDLVIVDEASQSDLWALPALLRAKKLLVVGDNKQVSPSDIAVRETDIRRLHARFLRDLPFGDMLTPGRSIYDLASVMFASDLVRLREHFRCVEPIIEFSNRLCYGGEIKCLRIPKATERITPPLIDTFVRDGAREARSAKINRAEARAIVAEIKSIASNVAFANRTIGVVSLLGHDQARLVFDLLLAELGEEAIVRHGIRCGDAMTFQGREADIVFISMVSDAETLRALSGEIYEQRFNVAVSRAKDRLYIYRSFRREDLKEKDLRARLLEHFAAPLRRNPEKAGRERCESDFERAVYDRLRAAGYRVTPQVSAGAYRIDLVVEGDSGRRLAIECDGDQYHTPDVWLADMHRQRALERVGWVFWRCWGSSFIRDPEACMSDLFSALARQHIEPIGESDIDLSEIVEYREVDSVLKEAPPFDLMPDGEEEDVQVQVAEGLVKRPIASSSLPLRSVQPDMLGEEDGVLSRSAGEGVLHSEVGDLIRFCYEDAPEDEAFVTIVDSQSDADLGLINRGTVVAKALLGMAVGEKREVLLPTGRRTILVIEVQKREHSAS